MSMVCPGLTKAGMTACTATAATFFSCGVTFAGTVTPSCANMLLQGLHGKGRLAGLVAGAVETDDQPVADQLVGAHALYLRHVFDAFGLGERRRAAAAPSSKSRLRMLNASCQYGA